MMLIKLESGNYVDTYYIERLWMINECDGYIRFANNRFANNPDVQITKNDFGLIVKAMEPNYLEDYDDALPDNLPVIPKAVGEYIDEVKARGKWSIIDPLWRVGDALNAMGESGLGDRSRWVLHHSDDFARAWVLGAWRVEETGAIMKLEAEK